MHILISCRQAFEKAAAAYCAEHYPNGVVGVYSSKEGGNFVITICISSALFNPKNYWYDLRLYSLCLIVINKLNCEIGADVGALFGLLSSSLVLVTASLMVTLRFRFTTMKRVTFSWTLILTAPNLFLSAYVLFSCLVYFLFTSLNCYTSHSTGCCFTCWQSTEDYCGYRGWLPHCSRQILCHNGSDYIQGSSPSPPYYSPKDYLGKDYAVRLH